MGTFDDALKQNSPLSCNNKSFPVITTMTILKQLLFTSSHWSYMPEEKYCIYQELDAVQ